LSRYKFFKDVIEPETGYSIKGFMRDDLSDLITFDDDLFFVIPRTLQYRPDIIAYNFYNDSKLSYMLIYANKITNSPEGFYEGRKIRVPRYERIVNLI